MKRLSILLSGTAVWLGLVQAVAATTTIDRPWSRSSPAAAALASTSTPMQLADGAKKKPTPTPAPAPTPIDPGSPYR